MKQHHYEIKVEWTGNQGQGTLNYRAYTRDHKISAGGKYQEIMGSSDPAFLGDKTRYNPEELFVSTLSTCHMLWFLHLCAVNHIVVTDYTDNATGIMEEAGDGSGRFTEVTLHPVVTISDPAQTDRTNALHAEAHQLCFIANSCNFPVKHRPSVLV